MNRLTPLVISCTAPTPSHNPRDPPSDAKNEESEKSGIYDSVTMTLRPNIKDIPGDFLVDLEKSLPVT